MTSVVICQPMFFPWVGLFEQVRLADVFIHYDDAQLPMGRNLMSRVQIKTSQGIQWLSVPIIRKHGQLIQEVLLDNAQNWRDRHLKTLKHCYGQLSFGEEMLDLVEPIYQARIERLVDFNIQAFEIISDYFNLRPKFINSSSFSINKKNSQKLLELIKKVDGSCYITGHGARNYLDHLLFEDEHIAVEYMNYKLNCYPQKHGDFTPFVSILDLIANMGSSGSSFINSDTKNWQVFCNEL